MGIPSEVLYIIETLNSKGHEAYMVGGCVRDHLMDVSPKDYDITTSATPDLVKKYFSRTYDTGVKHGTVTVLVNGKQFEVTTFRLDGEYLDFRHPNNVKFTKNIEEDLSRRDFTMNAIAYHMSAGFVDPFGGVHDIKNKTIRGVGDPKLRFQEDALRMLRALRFSAQLDFKIEDKTLCAIQENAGLITRISVERLRDELCKLLLSGYPEKISAVVELGLAEHIYNKSDYFTKNILEAAPFLALCEPELGTRLAVLLRFMPSHEAECFLKHLKFDNKTIRSVIGLIKIFEQEKSFIGIPKKYDDLRYEIKKRLCIYGVEPVQKALYIEKIYNDSNLEWLDDILTNLQDIVARGECFNLSGLDINGRKLKAIGLMDGPGIGNELNRLLDEVMRAPELNRFDALKSLVENNANASRCE